MWNVGQIHALLRKEKISTLDNRKVYGQTAMERLEKEGVYLIDKRKV